MTQRLDQSVHATAAAAALLPSAFWPNPITFAWAGLCMGFVREITEEGSPITRATVRHAVTSYRSRIDMAFWALGGFLAGIIGGAF